MRSLEQQKVSGDQIEKLAPVNTDLLEKRTELFENEKLALVQEPEGLKEQEGNIEQTEAIPKGATQEESMHYLNQEKIGRENDTGQNKTGQKTNVNQRQNKRQPFQ